MISNINIVKNIFPLIISDDQNYEPELIANSNIRSNTVVNNNEEDKNDNENNNNNIMTGLKIAAFITIVCGKTSIQTLSSLTVSNLVINSDNFLADGKYSIFMIGLEASCEGFIVRTFRTISGNIGSLFVNNDITLLQVTAKKIVINISKMLVLLTFMASGNIIFDLLSTNDLPTNSWSDFLNIKMLKLTLVEMAFSVISFIAYEKIERLLANISHKFNIGHYCHQLMTIMMKVVTKKLAINTNSLMLSPSLVVTNEQEIMNQIISNNGVETALVNNPIANYLWDDSIEISNSNGYVTTFTSNIIVDNNIVEMGSDYVVPPSPHCASGIRDLLVFFLIFGMLAFTNLLTENIIHNNKIQVSLLPLNFGKFLAFNASDVFLFLLNIQLTKSFSLTACYRRFTTKINNYVVKPLWPVIKKWVLGENEDPKMNNDGSSNIIWDDNIDFASEVEDNVGITSTSSDMVITNNDNARDEYTSEKRTQQKNQQQDVGFNVKDINDQLLTAVIINSNNDNITTNQC